MRNGLCRVTASRLFAGFVVQDGGIVRYAPILRSEFALPAGLVSGRRGPGFKSRLPDHPA